MLKLAKYVMVPFVALAVVALVGCGGEAAKPEPTLKPAEAAKPAETAKPAEAAKPVEAAKPADAAAPADAAKPAEEKKPDAAMPTSTPAAPAAAPAAGPALDAKTIVGTKWSAAGYALQFQDNGVVKINDDTEGTWKIEGDKLTIEAGGTTYDATIKGDKIMYNDSPLEKL